jgi:hypothetical protein
VSTRYPGGIITKTPVVPAGPYESGAAPGVWTLDQQLQAQKAGIWPLAGLQPDYIEDVFSTYLYTGNGTGSGSTQTITNGINLSGKGGLVWIKSRNSTAGFHQLFDTTNLATIGPLATNTSNPGGYVGAAPPSPLYLTVTGSGFTLNTNYSYTNDSQYNYASWTFREQPKFFDVVTYTGDGIAGRSIAHNLGSTPGCIIVKCTSLGATDWQVYHVGLGAMPKRIVLNSTNAADSSDHFYATPTSSVFYVNNYQSVNQNGATYVAYIFAHDAGGFGLTGTDNVISCGSYTGNGSSTGTVVTLGYEPQFLLIKAASGASNWYLIDNMRGMPVGSADSRVFPNTEDAEALSTVCSPTATGFQLDTAGTPNGSGVSYIYIAIRRGPMKVPTVGTTVFAPVALNAPANGTQVTTGFPVDLSMFKARDGGPSGQFQDRLRGLPPDSTTGSPALYPDATAAESSNQTGYDYWNTGYRTRTAQNAVWWTFRRAPGYFDVVCYSGTGSATTQTHNLAAVPELMIIKARNSTFNWTVKRNASLDYAVLNSTQAFAGGFEAALWNSTEPTSSVFSLGTNASVNGSGYTYVAYLFATVAGVSKVGTYTGTGTTLQINCGFTSGSRFVMIKRTDSTGDWYVWDSARGIIAGNDPYLFMNSAAAEVTNTDYVDTFASGFEISSTAPAAINANGGSFVFLAIA